MLNSLTARFKLSETGIRTRLLFRRFLSTKAAAEPRKNANISATHIILIDQHGKRYDGRPLHDVLKSIDMKLYDLVEVNASHIPPICKLISKSGAFKRTQAIDEAAAKNRLKCREKEIRFGTSLADHDYKIKLEHVKTTLEKAFRVRLVIEPKGVVNRNPLAKEQLWRRILDDLVDAYGKPLTILSAPQIEFRNLTATVYLANASPPALKLSRNCEESKEP